MLHCKRKKYAAEDADIAEVAVRGDVEHAGVAPCSGDLPRVAFRHGFAREIDSTLLGADRTAAPTTRHGSRLSIGGAPIVAMKAIIIWWSWRSPEVHDRH